MSTRIAVSGAHGFIGKALTKALEKQGYEIWPLVRKEATRKEEIFYDPVQQKIDKERLATCAAVINLAGKNLMAGWWSDSFKRELRDSRIKSTALIANALAQLSSGPRLLLNASAVGIYGNSGEREIDEFEPMAQGFLAKLCRDWEHATVAAKDAGIRVVNLRFANVIGKEGGMLRALLPLYKLGLGPIFGSGKQYMPIVALDDVVSAIIFALENQTLFGPTNVACPHTPTNEKFGQILAQKLNRSAWLRVPSWGLELMGEQGQIFLDSCRPVPRKLLDAGFRFAYPTAQDIMQTIEN